MNREEQVRLIESYIASSKFVLDKDNVLKRAEESPWASDTLMGLSVSDPRLALQLCVKVAETNGSDEMLERVANGPLLEILNRADPKRIDEICRMAVSTEALRQLLSCVWEENELPKSTWDAILEHSAR
jgi:hypothetical protein